MPSKSNVRKYTNKVLELASEGIISWEDVARSALSWMSEDDVKEMAYDNMLLDEDYEDFEDYE